MRVRCGWAAVVGLCLIVFAGCRPAISEVRGAAAEPAESQVAQATKQAPPAVKPAPVTPKPAAPVKPAPPPPPPDPSTDFFERGPIPTLRIRLTQKEEQQLRADQRRYVDCTLIEDDKTTFKKVKMKLKGAAGSFRNLDDRPAITLKMSGKKDDRFHGLEKFHLNNSVQDASYLNELLASQLCLEAGLPAARTTHARVYLNDRDLGFYVLKEGLDDVFLARHFKSPKGNLYDGGFCQDIDAVLEKDEGDGVDDLSDLKALVAACREGDQKKKWELMSQKVDIDRFLNFVALEMMMSHWDGYAQNRNNYRVYFQADTNKACFFPHGMDQMFADPNFSTFHVPGPMVTQAVMTNPEWMAKYRARVKELIPNFSPDKLHAKIDAAHARIRPAIAKIHEDRAKEFDQRTKEFKDRVALRQKGILAQLPPEPIAFTAEGYAAVAADWQPRPQGDAKLEAKEIGGKRYLSLETGPSNNCVASFRRKVLLAKGKYKLEVQVKTTNVAAIAGDAAAGAGVRLGGGKRTNQAIGTADQTVSHEFEVAEDLRDTELVLELRSTAGGALFDTSTIRVVRVK